MHLIPLNIIYSDDFSKILINLKSQNYTFDFLILIQMEKFILANGTNRICSKIQINHFDQMVTLKYFGSQNEESIQEAYCKVLETFESFKGELFRFLPDQSELETEEKAAGKDLPKNVLNQLIQAGVKYVGAVENPEKLPTANNTVTLLTPNEKDTEISVASFSSFDEAYDWLTSKH